MEDSMATATMVDTDMEAMLTPMPTPVLATPTMDVNK